MSTVLGCTERPHRTEHFITLSIFQLGFRHHLPVPEKISS